MSGSFPQEHAAGGLRLHVFIRRWFCVNSREIDKEAK